MPSTQTPSRIDPGEIVGIVDICDRLVRAGRPVTVETVQQWRVRAKRPAAQVQVRQMPDPDGWISRRVPWWFWSETILPWLTETGRI